MDIEDKIAEIVKENSGSIMHPKGHVVRTLDPQDLKDLTKSLVKNLGLFGVVFSEEGAEVCDFCKEPALPNMTHNMCKKHWADYRKWRKEQT